MNQSDKRDSENEILDEHRLPQVGATAHKDCGDEVGNEWISKSNAGVRRIFGWKVVAECETRDDAEMEWKIAEVIQQSGAESGVILDNCATEHFPENNRRDSVEKKIADRLCVGSKKTVARRVRRLRRDPVLNVSRSRHR